MVSDVAAALRACGQRITPQRLLILDAVRSAASHRTAEEIRAEIGVSFPYINVATVYRTLDSLREHGLVAATDFGRGQLEYEYVGGRRYHHLVCLRCGSRAEVADDVLDPLAATLRERYRFSAKLDHFAVFGVCHDCQGVPGEAGEGANRG